MQVYICIGVLALFPVSAHGRSETNKHARPSRVCPKTSHLSSHRLSLCGKTRPPGLPHGTWHEILIGPTGNHDSPTRSRSDPSTPVPEALAFFRPSWASTGPRSDLDLSSVTRWSPCILRMLIIPPRRAQFILGINITAQAERTRRPTTTDPDRSGSHLEMQTKATEKLSIWGTLDIVPAMVSVVAVAMFSALTGFFRSQQKDAPSLHLHVAYAILRRATERLSPVQLQWVQFQIPTSILPRGSR